MRIFLTRGLLTTSKGVPTRLITRYLHAGGPGSGPRPGSGLKLRLPEGVHPHQARQAGVLRSWKEHPNWKKQAYGGVIVNPEGQFLLREPANHFDGYHWTWPKGKIDDVVEHPVDTAVREVGEETGHNVKIIEPLEGTYHTPLSSSNFYLMRSTGIDPDKMDNETWRVHWASYEQAKALISQSTNGAGRDRDLAILRQAKTQLKKYSGINGSIMARILQAGGEGSGCHGPNCGRPSSNAQNKEYLLSNGVKLVDASNPRSPDSPAWNFVASDGSKLGELSLYTYKDIGKTIAGIHLYGDGRGKGLGGQAVQMLADHYGKISSDPQGNTSDLAVKMWERLGAKKVLTDLSAKGFYYSLYREHKPIASSIELASWLILAGGPGSGCHGENCGRPAMGKSAAGLYLKRLGWTHVGKTETPGKAGMKTAMKPTYTHPQHGKMWVGTSKSYHQNVGMYNPKVMKTAAVGEYVKGLHNAPIKPVVVQQPVVNPAAVQPEWKQKLQENLAQQPPAGMPSSFTHPDTGQILTWSPSAKGYTDQAYPSAWHSPEEAKEAFDKIKSQLTDAPAAPKGPPEGLPHGIKGPKGGEYKWNDEQQLYVHPYNPSYTISPKLAEKNIANGTYTPFGLITPKASAPNPDQPTGTIASPAKSTTSVPGSMNIAPDQFTFKDSGKPLGGAHDKYIFTDHNNNDWLFKPATTLGGQSMPMMGHADEMVSRIAQAIRPGYAIEAKAMVMDIPGQGKVFGSIQKMIPADKLRGEGGKFKDFVGRNLETSPLQPWETKHLQQEQVLDWLISNHDAHGGQFLRTSGQYVGSRSVIGIDKSQAFKYFGNDKLSTDYHPNATYGEKPPIYNEMGKLAKAGKLELDPNNALETIKHAEGISRDDYKNMLQPYADARYGAATSADKDKFLADAIGRKENLRSDFEKYYGDLTGDKKFKFEPVEDPTKRVAVNAPGKKADVLADNEKRPNNQAMLQAAIPDLLDTYKAAGKQNPALLDLSSMASGKWQSAYYKTDPTMPEQQRWEKASKGAGVFPELAAKVGLMPTDMDKLRDSIMNWKSSTSTEGARNIRASAQDIIKPGEELKSRFSAALQIEHELTKAKLAEMYPSKTMPVYRGLGGEVGAKLKAAKKSGAATIVYHTMGAEGWSDNASTAHTFGGAVHLHVPNMPIENVISSYKTSPNAMSSHLSEQESFIAFPDKKQYLKNSHIVVSSSMSSKKKTVIHIDGTKGQTHTAYPIPVKGAPKAAPEIITMLATDKNGKVYGKK